MKIDIHSHVTMPEMMGGAGEYGPERTTTSDGGIVLRVGPYTSRQFSPRQGEKRDRRGLGAPENRIKELDEMGVDKMGITISPLFYLYWAEKEVGVPWARLCNDSLGKFCGENSDRLFLICTLPLADIDESLKELDRAVNDWGAKGVNIGTDDLAGRNLDDPALWPLFEKIEKYDIPIFIHPYPLTMASGEEDRYNLTWVIGYTYQETLAFAHMTLGGALDDFPNLKIIISHGGGMVPYQFGRIEYASEIMNDVKAKKPLREYLKNFYFELLIHDLPAREYLYNFMGPDNLVVGSNYPGWDFVDGFEFLDELNVPEAEKEKIRHQNAARLFKLNGS